MFDVLKKLTQNQYLELTLTSSGSSFFSTPVPIEHKQKSLQENQSYGLFL